MRNFYAILMLGLLAMLSLSAQADVRIILKPTNNAKNPKLRGIILAQDTRYGLLLTPSLFGVPPGTHGFHLHTNASCEQQGKAAGGHYDPKKTNKHLGPYNHHGHLGDMPALFAGSDGRVTQPVLAPRLKAAQLKGHAVMLHAGGDNYADMPKKLGGGGARIACGVVS